MCRPGSACHRDGTPTDQPGDGDGAGIDNPQRLFVEQADNGTCTDDREPGDGAGDGDGAGIDNTQRPFVEQADNRTDDRELSNSEGNMVMVNQKCCHGNNGFQLHLVF